MAQKLLYLAEKGTLLLVASDGESQDEYDITGNGITLSKSGSNMVVSEASSTPSGSPDKTYELPGDPLALITLDADDDLCIIGLGDSDSCRMANNPDITVVVNVHDVSGSNYLHILEDSGYWKVWEL